MAHRVHRECSPCVSGELWHSGHQQALCWGWGGWIWVIPSLGDGFVTDRWHLLPSGPWITWTPAGIWAEVLRTERCASLLTTFPLGGPIVEEKGFRFSVFFLERVADELAPCGLLSKPWMKLKQGQAYPVIPELTARSQTTPSFRSLK